MKKLLFLLLIGIMLSVPSCKKDSDKNEINPLALLALLGNSSLTVTATYTGDAATDGTGRMFVYLYKSLGTTTRDPEPAYKGSTAAAAEIGAAQTITIDHIRGGEYYVLVFYDYHTGGNDDNQTDRYILYSGTAYTNGASKLTIAGDTAVDMGSFGNDYVLGEQSAFMTTDTYTLTVPVTYNGAVATSGTATKLMYVCLYNSLGTSTRNPALPVKMVQSAAVVESGVQQSIAVTEVIPGNYYVLVFYDSVKGSDIDSEGDPYAFFVNTPYTANAQKIVFAADATLPAISFGDTNTLQADGAFLTPSSTSTFTVTAQYTSNLGTADGSKKIYVYLYSALGTSPREPYLPIYTGSTDDAVIQNTDDTITITDVIPGDYYVLIFLDFKLHTSNVVGKNDKYELYDNCNYVSDADLLTISAPSTDLTGISFDSTWSFQDGSAYMVAP